MCRHLGSYMQYCLRNMKTHIKTTRSLVTHQQMRSKSIILDGMFFVWRQWISWQITNHELPFRSKAWYSTLTNHKMPHKLWNKHSALCIHSVFSSTSFCLADSTSSAHLHYSDMPCILLSYTKLIQMQILPNFYILHYIFNDNATLTSVYNSRNKSK
jgi:hypothetical protein